jgi:hypothetical protein
MARQYHLRSFLRDAPNVFLRRYLAEKGLALDLNWDALGETEITPIFNAFRDAADEVLAEIEADFRDIDAMATLGGVKTIIQEARFPRHGINLAAAFGESEGHHDRVFWAFLEYPRVFQVAREFYRADNLPGKSWKKRKSLPDVRPQTDAASRERLGQAISRYYVEREGRGHACEVEHYVRDDQLYWFVYPEDYAATSIEYDEGGAFTRRPRRPVFDLVFIHSANERTLRLYAPRSSPKTVRDLQQIWADAVMQGELGEPGRGGVVYELDELKRRVSLDFDPADGIEDVRINKLRLSLAGEANKRIVLEVNASENRDAIYDLLDEVVAEKRIPPHAVRVTQVGFQFVFRSATAKGGTETLNFDVTWPDLCSLKSDPHDEIAAKYLKKWGIDVSGSTARGPEAG